MTDEEGEQVVIDWQLVTNLAHTFSWAELYAAANIVHLNVHPAMSRRELAIRLATNGVGIDSVRYGLARKEGGF